MARRRVGCPLWKTVNFRAICYLKSIPNNDPHGQRSGLKLSSSRFAQRGDFGISSVSPDSADSLKDPHFRELSRAQSYAYEFPGMQISARYTCREAYQ